MGMRFVNHTANNQNMKAGKAWGEGSQWLLTSTSACMGMQPRYRGSSNCIIITNYMPASLYMEFTSVQRQRFCRLGYIQPLPFRYKLGIATQALAWIQAPPSFPSLISFARGESLGRDCHDQVHPV